MGQMSLLHSRHPRLFNHDRYHMPNDGRIILSSDRALLGTRQADTPVADATLSVADCPRTLLACRCCPQDSTHEETSRYHEAPNQLEPSLVQNVEDHLEVEGFSGIAEKGHKRAIQGFLADRR